MDTSVIVAIIRAIATTRARRFGSLLRGTLTLGDQEFNWSSGGRGRGSLPFGTYHVGGPEHHAILHGTAYPLSNKFDPAIGATRSALFIHSGPGIASLGCVHIPPEQFEDFKAAMAELKPHTLIVQPPTDAPRWLN